MLLSADMLIEIMPRSAPVAAVFLSPLNAAMREFGIIYERRIEMFAATLAVESGQLTALQESMNYRAERLMVVWPERFKTRQIADAYANRPELIANKVYANRMGNGDEASGDGWRYRGAGLIALTGRANQAKCAQHFGIPAEKVGDWLRTPEGACRSAAWFWKTHGCNELADAGNFDAVSDMVNIGHQTSAVGDAIGYKERLAFHAVAQMVVPE